MNGELLGPGFKGGLSGYGEQPFEGLSFVKMKNEFTNVAGDLKVKMVRTTTNCRTP